MKLLITLITFIYFLTLTNGSRLLMGDDEYGGKNKDDILGGYEKLSDDELKNVQLMVDLLRDDIVKLVDEIEMSSSLKVIRAEKQLVSLGENYQATVKVDGIKAYTFKFYEPFSGEEIPTDLELINTPSSGLVGAYEDCLSTCLNIVKDIIKDFEDDIIALFSLKSGAIIIVDNAYVQIVAGKKYKVNLLITDDGVTYTKTITYFVGLNVDDKPNDLQELFDNAASADENEDEHEVEKGDEKDEIKDDRPEKSMHDRGKTKPAGSEDSDDEGYREAIGEKFVEAELYVELLDKDIKEKCEVDCEDRIEVISASYSDDDGTNYRIVIKACEKVITITFYVPEVDSDDNKIAMPEDLKIEGDYVSASIFNGDEDYGDEDNDKESEEPCVCSLIYEPVACSKKEGGQCRTFASLCDALCNGKKEENCPPGECNDEVDAAKIGDEEVFECEDGQVKRNGECVNEAEVAAKIGDETAFECEDGQVKRNGECVNADEVDEAAFLAKAGDEAAFDCEDGQVKRNGECVSEDSEAEVDAAKIGDEVAFECEDGQVKRNGECVNEDELFEAAAGDMKKVDDECSKACESDGSDPICCWGKDYYNLCEAECAGIKKPEVKCEYYGKCEDYDGSDTPHDKDKNKDKECICTKEIEPICCNGVDYDNACLAECDNCKLDSDDCHDGKCTDSGDGNLCACPFIYKPVCCDDEQEFGNLCEAQCKDKDFDEDRCPEGRCAPKACPEKDEPICCNGIDFDNPCEAECAGIDVPAEEQPECVMEKCKDECVCTSEYSPFCCDGETYSNACQARCDDIFAPRLTCEKGSCEGIKCACPYIYQPICCNDENYPNACVAECVDIKDPEETCEVGTCEKDLCTCTREWNPRCCGEKTYGNPCEARCDGHKFINFQCDRGVCDKDEPCFCPAVYKPVCCNKGTSYERTFSNLCEAECSDSDIHCDLGECDNDPGCICPHVWSPVCCKGTKTYSNLCHAQCDGFSADQCTMDGTCEDIRMCTMEYRPMCCDGVTYSNACMAEADGIDEPAIEHGCEWGECDAQNVCTDEWEPLCCHGITYGNECNAKNAGYEDPVNDCQDGRCDHSLCTMDWRPLCCQGQTYANLCEAEIAGIERPIVDNCLSGRCEDQTCLCTADYAPLCCNEIDFSNKCDAVCNGFLDPDNQCVTGTCDRLCKCTKEHEPVCCAIDDDSKYISISNNNEIEFSNECIAECFGFDSRDCSDGNCGESICKCTRELNPICCNGETYANPCLAECDGVDAPAEAQEDQCFMGSCESKCVCTREHNPMCCDGVDYSNACVARCDGVFFPKLCSSGQCHQQPDDKLCVCTREYAPHCCDEKEYSNGCLAKCDGMDIFDDKQCSRGTCESECKCTLEIEEVCCGEHGREYDNECLAECAGWESNECKTGKCEDIDVCTMEHDPWCCDNNKDYGNKCLARRDGMDIEKDCERGECDHMCVCNALYDPHCCTDKYGNDIDYDNICVAECDDVKAKHCSKGKCGHQNTCVCNLDFNPLCCTDEDGNKQTYGNPCQAECRGFDAPAETHGDCEMGSCEETYCKCTRELDPHCCHGVDYVNKCVAECDKDIDDADDISECRRGNCKDIDLCTCTKESNPVCCTDDEGNDIDYANPCVAACDGIINPNKCSSGLCDDKDKLCKCTREYAAICCNDETYSNTCLAECDNQKLDDCKRGSCESNICKCTREENPYCCTDSNGDEIDYANPCEARCDGIIAPEFYCTRGKCSDKPDACTLEYAPFCCDSEDYANACFAERDGGFKDAENNDSCEQGRCCDVCVCTLELNPVCCGETHPKDYSNPCMAECAGYKDAENHEYCTMGECEQNCNCNRKYEPYCCDEKEEFSNGCIAECNGFKLNECDFGKCDHICACPKNIDTICCDEQEYDNACLAECDGFKDADTNSLCGECNGIARGGKEKEPKDKGSEEEPCTDEFTPQCCEDEYGIKVTWDNECLARTQGNIKDTEKDCTSGECKDLDCGCSKELDEYCCWDVTYTNECQAKCAGVSDPEEQCDKGECGKGSGSGSGSGDEPCNCPLIENAICCGVDKDRKDYASHGDA